MYHSRLSPQATGPSEGLSRSPPLAPGSHTLSTGTSRSASSRLRVWASQTHPDAHHKDCFTHLTAHNIRRRDGTKQPMDFDAVRQGRRETSLKEARISDHYPLWAEFEI